MGGQATEILTPNRQNGKVIIYCHGAAETQTAPRTVAAKLPTVALLLQQGYTIATSNAAGDNWGNAASVAAYKALHDHLQTTYAPNRMLWWCESMGGLSSLNTILREDVECDGWYGLEPGVNLAALYAGAFTAAINTAYNIPGGGTYAAQTNGYDPCLRTAAEFAGLSMRFVASPSDTTVVKADNTDDLVTLVTGQAAENSVVTVTGAHGDLSHYIPNDVLSFFDRCS